MQFSDIITFTRSTGGGRFNAQGQYEWLPANTPRFDFDPVTGEAKGLLIEESRTNLLTYSSDFANTAWIKTSVSVNPNAAIAPDGKLSAASIIESNGSTSPKEARQGFSAVAGTTYTLSVYAKAAPGDSRLLRVNFSTSGAFGFNGASFNLISGAIHSSVAGSAAVISPAGNGWYRCSISVPAVSTEASIGFFTLRNSADTPNYTGNGTSGIYIWGAQLEAGAFPTSYIPTTTAQVTRAADIASVNELSPWYNAEAGTFVIKHDAPAGRPLLSSGANVIAVSQGPGKLVVAYDAQGSYVSYNDSPYASGPALSIEAALDLFKSATSYMGARGQSVRYFPRKLNVSEGV